MRTLKIVKNTKTPARRGAQYKHINFKNDETSLNVRLLRANPKSGSGFEVKESKESSLERVGGMALLSRVDKQSSVNCCN